MYMADNTEISIRYVRLLNYTFYPLRDLPHKLHTTCSTHGSRHNQYSNSISNSEIVRGVQIMPRSKHFLFASWGTQIPFTWRNAYWGLWVEPTRSRKVISSFHPCQAFSYGHLGWNLIQLPTGHVSFPFPSILFLQKKTILHERYPGEIMVTKISSTVYWISSQWELWRETPYEICVCLFYNKVALLAEF